MAWDLDVRISETGFFDSAQKAQLAAIFRAICPTDRERGVPGADEADAVRFLDRLLSTSSVIDYFEIPDWRQKYPQWLAALDTAAQARAGKPLAQLDLAAMTGLLTALEAGQLAGLADQATIFKTLWRHCLQGCWADPRWGGNREGIMWRWMGYLQDAQNVQLSGQEQPA